MIIALLCGCDWVTDQIPPWIVYFLYNRKLPFPFPFPQHQQETIVWSFNPLAYLSGLWPWNHVVIAIVFEGTIFSQNKALHYEFAFIFTLVWVVHHFNLKLDWGSEFLEQLWGFFICVTELNKLDIWNALIVTLTNGFYLIKMQHFSLVLYNKDCLLVTLIHYIK